MWEILAELLKSLISASAGAAVGAGVGALTRPGGGAARGGMPMSSNPVLPGGVTAGTTPRPSSLSFPGGFTGGPPLPPYQTPGAEETPGGGGTGFATLGNPLLRSSRRGGFELPSSRSTGI